MVSNSQQHNQETTITGNRNAVFLVTQLQSPKTISFLLPTWSRELRHYPSKHHSADIHHHVHPYYVHMNNSPTVLPQAAKPSSWWGCAETLADPYKGKISLTRVDAFQQPFASCQVIKQDTPNVRKVNQYLEHIETCMNYSFPPIATEESQ